MKLRILNFLNVSNPSNLQADSGFIFQKLLMEKIVNDTSWDFYFICPKNTPLHHKKIRKLEIIEYHNKFHVRFNFEWNKIANAISDIVNDIDIVLVNQPEQSANMYVLANSISERNIPILTYFHYLPVIPTHFQNNFSNFSKEGFRFDNTLNRRGVGKIILHRYLESIIVSKCSITCSNFSQNIIRQTLLNNTKLTPDCRVIPPPVETKTDEKEYCVNNNYSKKIILYNHRLYDEYGTEKMILFLKYFYSNVSKDFLLIVTDPTYKRSNERNKLDANVMKFRKMLLDLPFVKFVHGTTRNEYWNLIRKCDFGLAPLKPSAAWSMAVMDLLAFGKPVLCPNYAAFPEMVGNTKLLYSSEREFERKLFSLMRTKTKNNISGLCKKQAQKFNIDNCSKKFIALFKEMM